MLLPCVASQVSCNLSESGSDFLYAPCCLMTITKIANMSGWHIFSRYYTKRFYSISLVLLTTTLCNWFYYYLHSSDGEK